MDVNKVRRGLSKELTAHKNKRGNVKLPQAFLIYSMSTINSLKLVESFIRGMYNYVNPYHHPKQCHYVQHA